MSTNRYRGRRLTPDVIPASLVTIAKYQPPRVPGLAPLVEKEPKEHADKDTTPDVTPDPVPDSSPPSNPDPDPDAMDVDGPEYYDAVPLVRNRMAKTVPVAENNDPMRGVHFWFPKITDSQWEKVKAGVIAHMENFQPYTMTVDRSADIPGEKGPQTVIEIITRCRWTCIFEHGVTAAVVKATGNESLILCLLHISI